MIDDEKLTLWLGAFRYYLGRRTYAVSDFCSLLRAEWKSLPNETQDLIRRELKEAKDQDDAEQDIAESCKWRRLGDRCDRAEWLQVLEVIDAG